MVDNIFFKKRLDVLLVGIISFSFLFFCELEFPIKWDDFSHLVNIFKEIPSNLQFGRLLFIYTNVLAFKISYYFFDIGPYQIYRVAFILNHLFAAMSLMIIYTILKNVFKNICIPSVSVAIMLSNSSLMLISSSVLPDLMMFFLALIGQLFLFEYIKTKIRWPLVFAAVFFALSFHAKEQSLLYIPAIMLMFLVYQDDFDLRAITLFFLVYLLVCFAGVVFLAIQYNFFMQNTLLSTRKNFGVDCPDFLWQFFKKILVTFFLFTIYIHLYKTKKLLKLFENITYEYKKLISLVLLLSIHGALIYVFFPFFIIESYELFIESSRYFFTLEIGLLICFISLLDYGFLKQTQLVILISILLLFAKLVDQYSISSRAQWFSRDNKFFNEKIFEKYKNNMVFIVGQHSTQLEYYFALDQRENNYSIIYSGWSWPHKKLEETVQNYLNNNMSVLVERFTYFNLSERSEVEDLLRNAKNVQQIERNVFLLKPNNI